MQKELRKRVRLAKAMQNISYKEIAYYLEVAQNTLYQWLRGRFDFSEQTAKRLKEILDTLEE